MPSRISTSPMPVPRGKVPHTSHDLDIIFSQTNPFQDLLRFQHDPPNINPAVSIVQEYARAIRLMYIRTRWSKLGLSDWHSEMNMLLCARASTSLALDIWDPLDDFFDTYLFEMEIQPSADLDAQGRKCVKRGLLRQLHDTAMREMESSHSALCDVLEGSLSNWRVLDTRLLALKKTVWTDCEKRGSFCLSLAGAHGTFHPASLDREPISSSNSTLSTCPFTCPISTDTPVSYTTPYMTPPSTDYPSSYTSENTPCYTPPPSYSPTLQTYIY